MVSVLTSPKKMNGRIARQKGDKNGIDNLCKSKSENEKKHYIEQYQIINKKKGITM